MGNTAHPAPPAIDAHAAALAGRIERNEALTADERAGRIGHLRAAAGAVADARREFDTAVALVGLALEFEEGTTLDESILLLLAGVARRLADRADTLHDRQLLYWATAAGILERLPATSE